MSSITSMYTSGDTAVAITPNTTELPPLDPDYEIDDALNYASDAVEAIESLVTALESKNYTISLENYAEKFFIPQAALESAGSERLKKSILYLYAFVKRMFVSIIDFITNYTHTARSVIPRTKDYIGRSDSLTSAMASQVNIKDRSLMMSLHINGKAPEKLLEQYERIATQFEAQYKHSVINEVASLVSSAKQKNKDAIVEQAGELKNKLIEGLEEITNNATASDTYLFSEPFSDENNYYCSDVLFGQNHITAIVGKELKEDGTFYYRCGIRRDSEVALRVGFFPVLTPEEIRGISRISLRIAENVIRQSRDETLLKKVIRDAEFTATKEVNEETVAVLKDISTLGQSSYIVYLRYTVKTMRSLMRWSNVSLKLYEGVKSNV